MPNNKDFKRLVRARMDKTGESYTTARAQLLKKGESQPAEVPPEKYAEIAGMSDEAVKAKTGCEWATWVAALDYAKADQMEHREIAKYVHEKFDVSGWWAQTVTVGYERIKGLRDIGQRRDGSYEANKSKTIPVPIDALYRAFEDPERREEWLPGVDLTVKKATTDKSMRLTWADGTPLEVYFYAKGDAKSQVTLQHRKLPSKEAVEETKSYWAERLSALAEVLTEA